MFERKPIVAELTTPKAQLLLIALFVLGVFVLTFVTGCGNADETSSGSASTDAPAQGEDLTGMLTVEGSDTMVNIAQAWAEKFMDENPGVMITIKGGGSGAGIAALINDTVDFALSSRDVKDSEFEEGEAHGVDIVENVTSYDGIAVIVNPASGMTGISLDDLGKVYRGEITNWSEVGGNDLDIVLIGRDSASGTFAFFHDEVVGADNDYSPSMRNIKTNMGIVSEVTGNPGAVGYVGMGYVTDDTVTLEIDGVYGTVDHVLDGSYPLSRRMLMLSNGQPAGIAKAFFDWIEGPAGQQIVADEGFVPVN
ncbi:MAG: phosphate ABC transporter substrate-binding protein [Coriobacteriia bacterium]|nr:phosphate ABC transporter substrate-binding protein [Coriobacteriia bacterium]MCL2537072.1 phosphate ABC transporter substrate-binding protein [Coriobacteriia bacterium]